MKSSRIAWITGLVLIAAWVILGHFFDSSPHLGWLPKWAVVASVAAPLAWITIYTVQGLLGAGKWWQSDLGVNMVALESAVVCTNGILFWAVLFHHGSIDTPGIAWAYIGGLLGGALIITWRSVIWLRAYRKDPPMIARIRELETENARLRAALEGDR